MTGLVSLVGAGPGDPELLTRSARAPPAPTPTSSSTTRSSRPTLLALAPTRAAVLRRQARRPSAIDPGRNPSPDDPRGAARPARRAAQVRRSVRVRPRRRRGARARGRRRAFEIVPGRHSRDRRAALAGIPVTHRGLASGVRRRLGPRRDGVRAGPGSLAPGSATLVVLMGIANRAPTRGDSCSRAAGRHARPPRSSARRLARTAPSALARDSRHPRRSGASQTISRISSASVPSLELAGSTAPRGTPTRSMPRGRVAPPLT